jgi:hypothetical protein
MCTRSGRWAMSLFQSFDFIKTKVEKHPHALKDSNNDLKAQKLSTMNLKVS